MTRRECLDKAAECVLRDRASQYGGPEDNFGRIARLWSTYTGTVLDGIDVAMMMALLKVARIRNNKDYSDSYIDLAGYAACGAELAGRAEAYRQSIEAAGEEYKKLRAEAEGDAKSDEDKKNPLSFEEQAKTFAKHNPPEEPEGNYPENPDSSTEAKPKFKHGDKVQCRVELPSVSDRIWVDGEYVRYEKGRSRPHVVFTRAALELVSDEDIRPVPKAEGCEALVEKDAPQTPHELYKKIIASNPVTFEARTPTGEELAEMAEEEGHE